MRLAVLGLGFMGATHVRALRSVHGAELAAVYSGDERKLAGDLTAVRGNLGAPFERMDFSGVRKHRDLDAVLADRSIDAIDICLPTWLHDSVAIEAMREGKHVLVEKPMALDGFAADRMVNSARRYRRVLMTAHVLRFLPEYAALREAARGHSLRFAAFRRYCAAPSWSQWLYDTAQSGGGAFDLLVHDVDFCLHLFGMPRSVSAAGYSDDAAGVDCVAAHLSYADGATVAIEGGWLQSGDLPFTMEYTACLDDRTIEYSSHSRAPTLYPSGGGAQPLPLDARDGYAAEIEYFAECCRTGEQPERCPAGDSAAAVKLMNLILQSRSRRGAKLLWTP